MIINWNDSYATNIKSFDREHQHLVKLLNQLHQAMSEGKGQEVMGKILDDLISYTATHFAHEERVLKQHGYADFDAHKAQHEALKEQVSTLQQDFKAGRTMISVKVLNFLKQWLTEHIMGSDMDYSEFLQKKNVA